MTKDMERLARALAPETWARFDARCVRKEWTADERAEELAEELARPERQLAKSLASVRALLLELRNPTPSIVKGVRERVTGYPGEREVSAMLGAVVDSVLAEDQG